jgi:monofunctional biosynthetic peptidoglycan transglycosylase
LVAYGGMARASRTSNKPKGKKAAAKKTPFRPVRWVMKWLFRGALAVVALTAVAIVFYAFVNPPTTPYMFSEGQRVGGVEQTWVPIEDIAPVMARAAVAAEDANFCLHWGLDVTAIRRALDDGNGGASTISQQTVKNVYLWHGRSWFRKAVEAVLTPAVELVWSKRRILEVYLNVAEFDEGIFGVQAAARHYFGVDAADLTPTQAARLAAILPAPQTRSAANPSPSTRRRAAGIVDGAATIDRDGRADCFQ